MPALFQQIFCVLRRNSYLQCLLLLGLAACSSNVNSPQGTTGAPTTGANQSASGSGTGGKAISTFEQYKLEVAHRILDTSSGNSYAEAPQALLQAVIVLRFTLDANGQVKEVHIQRSNHLPALERVAIASVHKAAPFSPPPSQIMHKGRVEISESWLFNDDGRFQLRSTALPQRQE